MKFPLHDYLSPAVIHAQLNETCGAEGVAEARRALDTARSGPSDFNVLKKHLVLRQAEGLRAAHKLGVGLTYGTGEGVLPAPIGGLFDLFRQDFGVVQPTPNWYASMKAGAPGWAVTAVSGVLLVAAGVLAGACLGGCLGGFYAKQSEDPTAKRQAPALEGAIRGGILGGMVACGIGKTVGVLFAAVGVILRVLASALGYAGGTVYGAVTAGHDVYQRRAARRAAAHGTESLQPGQPVLE